MKHLRFPIYLIAAGLIVSSTSCLTRRTVIRDGREVESKYVFKRPIKDALSN